MQIGEVIDGKYLLVRLIGEGGMGVVYEAKHTGIGRRVALKILHSRLSKNREFAARFMREAQAAAAIGSEHIVSVTDNGSCPDGTPYLVMEYLEGEEIAVILKRDGAMDPARAVRLITQVCRGLSAAHSQGIVHRDLKPENLMLTRREDGAEWIKILDFGVAKVRDALAAEEGRLTSASAFLGTPHYMAPEQIEGAGDVDHRADIYSTGVVLYEMLTGSTPFRANSLTQLLVMLTSSTPPPLRSLRPDVSPALEAIVARALSREASGRYAAMDELAGVLAPHAESSSARVPMPTMAQGQSGIDALAATVTPTGMGALGAPPGGLGPNLNQREPSGSFASLGTPSPANVSIGFGTTPAPLPSTTKVGSEAAPAPSFSSEGSGTGGHPMLPSTAPSSPVIEPVRGRRWWMLGVAMIGLLAAVAGAVTVMWLLDERGSNGRRRTRRNNVTKNQIVTPAVDAGGASDSGPSRSDTGPPPGPACPMGKVASAATAGQCCWPGQRWALDARTCTGRPQCPMDMVVSEQRCACSAGKVVGSSTEGHCCWPNQAWSKAASNCVGAPTCPDGYWVSGEECRLLPECPLGKRATAASLGNCCWPGQTWTNERCSGMIQCPTGFTLAGTSCQPDDSELGKLVRSCFQGKAPECSDLGVRYERGNKVEQSHDRAAQLYRKACDGGNAIGCYNLGVLYENGLGIEQSHVLAARLYRQACTGGSAHGCTGIATAYHLGQGVEQDYTRASEVYRQACEQGQALACGNLGTLLIDGDGLPRDLLNGASYLRRACDANNSASCCSLGVLHLRGMGVARDDTQARVRIEQACRGGAAWACEWLQNPTILGQIVPNHTYRVIATRVQGDAPIGEGAQCTLSIGFALGCGFNCRLRVTCGSVVVYGARASGYNRCRVTPSTGNVPAIEAHDGGASPDDGDPRIDVWTTAGRVDVGDTSGGSSWSATLQVAPLDTGVR